MRLAALSIALLAVLALPAAAAGDDGVTVASDFESPLFGLAAPNAGPRLLVADAGAGPTRVRWDGSTSLIAPLPGVSDVVPLGIGSQLALTSGAPSTGMALWRIVNGHPTKIANLLAFERRVDPADDGVESNPFDLAPLRDGGTLIADAAGNSILRFKQGTLDWVASLPQHLVSTRPLKQAAGCPNGPPDICGLPAMFPADPVATSVAIGPDGAIYAGELTGFPATPGTSRIWRIEPDARHAKCGASPACSVVARGFTSILDLAFGSDGTAYVVELDEASWLALEQGAGIGGTVNACHPSGGGWSCSKLARNLSMPTAVAVHGDAVYSTLDSLIPGAARVVRLR